MKWLLILLSIINVSFAKADEVKIEINPTKPVAGEVFQAYFRIFTESDEEPSINFSPSGVEVVGKSNQGISTRTIYANGKLSVSREMTYVYDLVASKAGNSALRDITVQLGSKTLKHPMISLRILKEPEVQPEVFVMADVPKKRLFLGEGVVVRYYLYSKVNITSIDVKKYPKLSKFLKRFLQEADRSERVTVDGQLYLRNQIYAAKLFPEKVGTLNVDSIHLTVTYPNIRSGDPFAAFGMSRDLRTKKIFSDPVKVEVQPVPAPAPPHFTGLVGKHDFDIQFGQNKLIVNQPLEVTLTVTGGGALENLEAPRFLKNPELEEFETNGDLKIANADQGTKSFDYTFLAKSNVMIPSSKLILSYFDPESEEFIPTELTIPEIVIAGGSRNQVPEKTSPPVADSKNKSTPPAEISPPSLADPLTATESSYQIWLPYVNSTLSVLAVLLALGWFIRKDGITHFQNKRVVPAQFRKGNFSLSDFTKWLTPAIQKTAKSPLAIINDSDLTPEAKRYFIDLLNSNDYKDYSSDKAQMKYQYNAGHFKQLSRYIESVKNESPSQPS